MDVGARRSVFDTNLLCTKFHLPYVIEEVGGRGAKPDQLSRGVRIVDVFPIISKYSTKVTT